MNDSLKETICEGGKSRAPRTLAWGFGYPDLSEALGRLEKDNVVQVVVRIDKDPVKELAEYASPVDDETAARQLQSFRQAIFEDVYRLAARNFMMSFVRRKPYGIGFSPSYTDQFMLFFNYYTRLLVYKDVEFVLANGGIPHHGFDFILQAIIEAVGIPYIKTRGQQFEEDRCFVMKEYSKVGKVNYIDEVIKRPYKKIERKITFEYSYLKELSYPTVTIKDTASGMLKSAIDNYWTKSSSSVLMSIVNIPNKLKMSSVNRKITRLKDSKEKSAKDAIKKLKIKSREIALDIKARNKRYRMLKSNIIRKLSLFPQSVSYTHLWRHIARYERQRDFEASLESIIVNDVDLNEKFVYFPLQLQPELTSNPEGLEYDDQCLALERLRGILPDDYWIYIKENPLQEYHYRSKSFFNRIRKIPKLKFVGRKFNTFKLQDHCQFVATLTGTAAYEILTRGKGALFFGEMWLLNFPGTFSYSPDMDINEVINYRTDFEAFERAFNELYDQTIKANPSPHQMIGVDGFSREENINDIERAYHLIMNSKATTAMLAANLAPGNISRYFKTNRSTLSPEAASK